MNIIEICIILSIVSCIISSIVLPLTLYALILVKSLEKQTHTVQFMPTDEALDPSFSNQEVLQGMNTENKEDNEEIYRMV
ncbi:MAG: hypothetical protein Unbinned8261contig1001_46 [Prokaryotic dsDNA virus sp.]|nr:MAG: hypothetical protein Unbinned8261contig1001_46 [Prokaryotic dsDNA virus sp.]